MSDYMITENISEDYQITIDILSFPVFQFVSIMRILVILVTVQVASLSKWNQL